MKAYYFGIPLILLLLTQVSAVIDEFYRTHRGFIDEIIDKHLESSPMPKG